MIRRLLITGCNGFIGGKAAAKFLSVGDEVFGLDKVGDAVRGVCFRRGGVSQESVSAFGVEFDAIVHLAGPGTVRAAASDAEAARRDTVEASAGVLEYLRLHPQTKMIFISSAAVYGNDGGVLREDMPRNPISVYGKLKAEVEDMCRECHERYGCRINVVRPFSVYGKGLRKQLLWDFCGRVMQAKHDGLASIPCYGTGLEQRDFVNVDDLVGLISMLVEKGPDWAVLNCGTGVATTVNEVLAAICREMGYDGRLEYDNLTRAGDPLALVADIGRMKDVGFSPSKSFDAGVVEYVHWYEGVM